MWQWVWYYHRCYNSGELCQSIYLQMCWKSDLYQGLYYWDSDVYTFSLQKWPKVFNIYVTKFGRLQGDFCHGYCDETNISLLVKVTLGVHDSLITAISAKGFKIMPPDCKPITHLVWLMVSLVLFFSNVQWSKGMMHEALQRNVFQCKTELYRVHKILTSPDTSFMQNKWKRGN